MPEISIAMPAVLFRYPLVKQHLLLGLTRVLERALAGRLDAHRRAAHKCMSFALHLPNRRPVQLYDKIQLPSVCFSLSSVFAKTSLMSSTGLPLHDDEPSDVVALLA